MEEKGGKSNFLHIDADNDLLSSFLNNQDMEEGGMDDMKQDSPNGFKSKQAFID